MNVRILRELLMLLLTGLVFFTSSSSAQKFFTRIYTEADGLSSSKVYDIEQDSSGLIWFATRSGISSYNGISFKSFNIADGLTVASNRFIICDSKGVLWALPEHGVLCVSRFIDEKWESYSCFSKAPKSVNYSAFDICNSDAGELIAVGTELDGIFIFRGDRWKHYTVADGLACNEINAVKWIDSQLYIGTTKGLSIIRDNRVIEESAIPPEVSKRGIYSLNTEITSEPAPVTRLWILGIRWLGYLENNKIYHVASGFLLPTDLGGRASFIYPDKNGGVYFGNIYYVYYYSGNTHKIETLGRKNGLISEGGTAVLTDRENNLWITGYRGITKISSKRFTIFTESEGLYDNEVSSALEIRPGKYVFGHHGVLTFYDGKKFSYISLTSEYNVGKYNTRIQDIAQDKAGNLWVAASELGLARISPSMQVTWFGISEGLSGVVYSVVTTPPGQIFIATTVGLFRYTGQGFERLHTKLPADDGIRKIFSGPDNELYLATYRSGLIRMKDNHVIQYASAQNHLERSVSSFYQDTRGNRWVGTAAGLFIIIDSTLKRPALKEMNINRPIYLILEDHMGQLWFGTDNGLYRWNGTRLEHFTIRDGVSGQEINRDAGFMDHQHHLWFGTNNGITIYQPEQEYDIQKIPYPVVKLYNVETKTDTFELENNIHLSYDRNNLVFNFSAVSFIDERDVFYKCKLDGLEKEWSREFFYHNNSYRYNNLPPGTYRFCIKARNALGIWSDPVCSAEIHIRQPFWFHWWFILLAGIALLGISFVTVRMIFIRRYNLRLAKMVALRTRELRKSEKKLLESNTAKDNFFSIIAHDLKSPFNAMLGMLELLTTDYHEYTDDEKKRILLSLRASSTRTIDLLENLLTWAQTQKGIIPFDPNKFDIMELISENLALFEPSALAKTITLDMHVNEIVLVYADRNMINTVLRNLISNAVKFTHIGGAIRINAIRGTGEWTISVEDNGTGIQKEMLENLFKIEKRTVSKGTNNESGTGLGLILCKEFIEKNRGELFVASEVGRGTVFSFTLPVNPA